MPLAKRSHLKQNPGKPRIKVIYTGRTIGVHPELAPGQFIRTCDADLIWHHHAEHVPRLVKDKKLPAPVGTYPGSRAKGWTSEQINAFRQRISEVEVA